MEATPTTSKDMPESLALSDIVAIPEPGSTIVNPHDIPLHPFGTQPSQDQEFASRYPPSAPQDLLRASQPLNPEDGRGYVHVNHHIIEYAAQQAEDCKDDGRRHHSLNKVEHQNSKANRRGPMDEMRQLIRILVKLIPDSLPHLKVDEAGGGNRVTEEDIKAYLVAVVGFEAPTPKWGLPDGWGSYLAELFTWAAGSEISRDEAMRCAKRLPGRSWEAVDEELARLGLCPARWPMPLTQVGVREANAGTQPLAIAPAPLNMPLHPRIEASRVHMQEEHPAAPKRKRARLSLVEQVELMIKDANEVEIWHLLVKLLQEARRPDRAGSTPPSSQMELQMFQDAVKKAMESFRWPQASSQHPGTFPGGEALYHPQYAISTRADQYFLQATSAPGLVASLGPLAMQNCAQLVQSGLQSYAMAAPSQLALPGLEGIADASADANTTKPLRPTARSVQQLGMHPNPYQRMLTPGAEAAAGVKVLSDSQKFLGSSGFAPYSGAPRSLSADALDMRFEGAPGSSEVFRVEGPSASSAVGAAEGPHSAKPSGDPRQQLRGIMANVAARALVESGADHLKSRQGFHSAAGEVSGGGKQEQPPQLAQVLSGFAGAGNVAGHKRAAV